MNTRVYRCPVCKAGRLRALPDRERPSYYRCRSCSNKFRVDYRPDPQQVDRVLVLAVRQNPEVDKELNAACSGGDFMERAASQVEKLEELKKQGFPMELETFCIGHEDAPQEDE